MAASKIIEIEKLSHHFGKVKAIDDLSLSIDEASFVTIVGPDGAGKTTLLRLIAALLVPMNGNVTLAGYSIIHEAEKIQEIIGYMPQRFGLYEDLTVQQNLDLYAELRGVGLEERKERFEKILEMTNLFRFTNRLAGNLSGGMKQKLGLGCALIKEPKVLILDEPSVGVDPLSRKELWQMVQEFHQKKVTILWSTSYLDEAEQGDFTILLNQGKVLYQGIPSNLTKRAEKKVFFSSTSSEKKREDLRKYLSMPDILDVKIEGDQIRILSPQKKEASWKETNPSFEDGFMELLGGGPKEISPLFDPTKKLHFSSHRKTIIHADHLTKEFKNFRAVDNIAFEVKEGEIFGLLGPNGAGKSTTFRMLCGLLKPTLGKAIVNEVSLETAPSLARSQIGYMAQKFSLYGDLSVLQNLFFFAGLYSLSRKKKEEMIDQMIQMFQFHPFLDLSTKDLPIGFKQRLSLACSILHDPKVLFLDEPTSGVDPITRREFWNHINALAEKGCTIMVTTHFMDEADYCDRIALIYQSQMIHMGTPKELKEKAHAQTLQDAFIHLIEAHR